MGAEKQACLWNSHVTQYSKDTADFLQTLINDSRLANKFRCGIREIISKGKPLPSDFGDSNSSVLKCTHLNKKPSLGALRTRDKIIASGAYDVPKFRPIKDFKSRDQEKNRLASIFAYGEDLETGKASSTKVIEEKPAQISRFDELFDELQDRQTFLEEMRSLGKAADYEAKIKLEMSQIVQEMEEIDKQENTVLAQLQQNDRSHPHQHQADPEIS